MFTAILRRESTTEGYGIAFKNIKPIRPHGVSILGIVDNSIAYNAGLKQGEVIAKINDEDVTGRGSDYVKSIFKDSNTVIRVTVFRKVQHFQNNKRNFNNPKDAASAAPYKSAKKSKNEGSDSDNDSSSDEDEEYVGAVKLRCLHTGCKQVNATYDLLLRHYRFQHKASLKELFSCKRCPEIKFDDLKIVNAHIGKHFQHFPHPKKMTKKTWIAENRVLHADNERPLIENEHFCYADEDARKVCQHCQKALSTTKRLNAHILKWHTEYLTFWVCMLCNNDRIYKPNKSRTHVMAHHKQSTFSECMISYKLYNPAPSDRPKMIDEFPSTYLDIPNTIGYIIMLKSILLRLPRKINLNTNDINVTSDSISQPPVVDDDGDEMIEFASFMDEDSGALISDIQSFNSEIDTTSSSFICPKRVSYPKNSVLNSDSLVHIELDTWTAHEFSSWNDVNLENYVLKRSISKNLELDEDYLQMYSHKLGIEYCENLPLWKVGNDILDTLDNRSIVVVDGGNYIGKSSEISQIVLGNFITTHNGSKCNVICVLPHDLNCFLSYDMLNKQHDMVTEHIGYATTTERNFPRKQGSILYCTPRVFLTMLHISPDLLNTSHVIIDDIHIRSFHMDLICIFLKRMLSNNRNIKVILNCATNDYPYFSNLIMNAPVIKIPDNTNQIEEFWLDDIFKNIITQPRKYRNDLQQLSENELEFVAWVEDQLCSVDVKRSLKNYDFVGVDYQLIFDLIKHICSNLAHGSILVFLPDWYSMSSLQKLIANSQILNQSTEVIALHSDSSYDSVKGIFRSSDKRKIIISTDIGETSVPIANVAYVIDSGKMKMKKTSNNGELSVIVTDWTCQSTSHLRSSKAGWSSSGVCFKLFTKFHKSKMEKCHNPEFHSSRISDVCLQIKSLRLGIIKDVLSEIPRFFDSETISKEMKNLRNVGALDEKECLTGLGHHLVMLPVSPYIGKILIFGATFSCLEPIITIAAIMSVGDIFNHTTNLARVRHSKLKFNMESESDHIALYSIFKAWKTRNELGENESIQFCDEYGLVYKKLLVVQCLTQQFADILLNLKFIKSNVITVSQNNKNSHNVALLKAIICWGLYPNVAKIVKLSNETRSDPNGPILQGNSKEQMCCSSKSVLRIAGDVSSNWCVYNSDAHQTLVDDSTIVTPLSLLLSSGVGSFYKIRGGPSIARVDKWITFQARPMLLHLTDCIKELLDICFENKVISPCHTNWSEDNAETRLLNVILDLLTAEKIELVDGARSYNRSISWKLPKQPSHGVNFPTTSL